MAAKHLRIAREAGELNASARDFVARVPHQQLDDTVERLKEEFEEEYHDYASADAYEDCGNPRNSGYVEEHEPHRPDLVPHRPLVSDDEMEVSDGIDGRDSNSTAAKITQRNPYVVS